MYEQALGIVRQKLEEEKDSSSQPSGLVKDMLSLDSEATQSSLERPLEIENIVWKRLLKRLWGVVHLEVQNKEDIFKLQGKKSVAAWDDFKGITEMYFNLLKDIFSDIYRDKKPLSSELVCENAVRALSS